MMTENIVQTNNYSNAINKFAHRTMISVPVLPHPIPVTIKILYL